MQNSANQIQVFYELNVLPSKADELKEIASKMVSMNAAEDRSTEVFTFITIPKQASFMPTIRRRLCG